MIPENVSEKPPKPKRGRPPAFAPAYLAAARNCCTQATERGRQNFHYAARAIAQLNGDPAFDWLLNRPGGAHRQTILAELGRIRDPDRLLAAARHVCAERLRTAAAVAFVRRFQGTRRSVNALDLSLELVKFLDAYRRQHPEIGGQQIRAALANAADEDW